ncbi:MAG: hypothetical protein DWQ04_22415 [Chloroflexi bacterium]|nr:MAG: hypothetical protein DWQ04_22415 [Chloroflexota bacterium]
MDAEERGKTRKEINRHWIKCVPIFLLIFVGGCTAQPSEEYDRIAYLNWDENGRIQLYATTLTKNEPEQLTNVEGDVHSYAAAPDGSQLVYVIRYENGRSELWQLKLNNRFFSASPKKLLTCENALCSQPIWAPDNRRIIYEKRELLDDGGLGLPVLWWLDVKTSETITVLEDAKPPNQAASISPNGEWLSYASPPDEGIVVYGLENGRFFYTASYLNVSAAWNIDSTQLITSDFNTTILHGDEGVEHLDHTHNSVQSIHLFISDIGSENRHQLTEGISVDDGTPVWSPDGQWIAFGRKLMFTNTGRQIWLVRSDGSEAIPLTDDLMVHHGSLSWDKNGRFLLFQKFNTTTPDTSPSIHTIDIETKTQQEIVPTGFLPSWIQ